MLELHKEQVNVVGFVRESVALFNMQVNTRHPLTPSPIFLDPYLSLDSSPHLVRTLFCYVFECVVICRSAYAWCLCGYQARDCGVQLQVVFQPFDGTLWRGGTGTDAGAGTGTGHGGGSVQSAYSRDRRLGNLARTASAVLRGAVQAQVSGRGLGIRKSSSLSSRLHNNGARWPVVPASEPPIDQRDAATVDRFKIEQVGWRTVHVGGLRRLALPFLLAF